MYLIDKSFALLDELVSDETKRNEAKEIIRKCYDEGNKYFIICILHNFIILYYDNNFLNY